MRGGRGTIYIFRLRRRHASLDKSRGNEVLLEHVILTSFLPACHVSQLTVCLPSLCSAALAWGTSSWRFIQTLFPQLLKQRRIHPDIIQIDAFCQQAPVHSCHAPFLTNKPYTIKSILLDPFSLPWSAVFSLYKVRPWRKVFLLGLAILDIKHKCLLLSAADR